MSGSRISRGAGTGGRRRAVAGAAAAALVLWLALGAARPSRAHDASRHPRLVRLPLVSIGRGTEGPAIPSGFLGVSMEIDSLLAAAGSTGPVDPVLAGLIQNLAPGQRPVLRLGGQSTDWTWAPAPGAQRPSGAHYSLTPIWFQRAQGLAQLTNARLILGVNLRLGSRLAAAEANALVRGIGRRWILAFEPGNEPELYRAANGRQLFAPGLGNASANQGFQAFLHTFSGVAGAMPASVAGPSVGSDKWLLILRSFLRRERRVGLATVHRYPLKHCTPTAKTSVPELLSDASSHGLAQSLGPYVRVAAAAGRGLRIDEMNSVSCGGQAGVSNTFASALWALDAMFEMARAGVAGVNFHNRPGFLNQLFELRHSGAAWSATVHPEYYGLLSFALAAPAGSRLLRVSVPPTLRLHVWATRSTTGALHAVLINDASRARSLQLRMPGLGTGSLIALRAPGPSATAGTTLGGQSFGSATTSGQLAGPRQSLSTTPRHNVVRLTVPPWSAVIMTTPTGTAPG